MVKAGFLLNMLLVPVVLVVVWLLGGIVFDLQIDMMPEWVE
jgi:hypothetical protein